MPKGKIEFINRELSWLDFNQRVLEEAGDPENPLLERVKFLAITASNLDEFFMVRVTDLKARYDRDPNRRDNTGTTADMQYHQVMDRCHDFMNRQYVCWEELRALLEQEGIVVTTLDALSGENLAGLELYFEDTVYPVLTPMAVDSSHPFPVVANNRINLAVQLEGQQEKEEDRFATVQLPSILPRFVPVGHNRFILLEELMMYKIHTLFEGCKVKAVCPFRITRDSDLNINEESGDLMREMELSIRQRIWGEPMRLEVAEGLYNPAIMSFLREQIEIQDNSLFFIDGPMDLAQISKLTSLDRPDLKDPPRPPLPPRDFAGEEDIFAAIRRKDRLMHLPYESFDVVAQMIRKAASDPSVLAIKQTLYRVSGQSPVVAALIEAAENGKQVTALVELKARFDEENNMNWARRLEQAGCHVIYGLAGLKTHCKVLLVVRREEDGICRYVHLGTGNYNDSTARLYTDMGLFTCAERMGADASALFNLLTGYSIPQSWNKLAVAPSMLRTFFYEKIQREIDNALLGRQAGIRAKVNSLVDPGIIRKLYQASQAGVKIELIVRGMCCLVAGQEGLSENIAVRSIVGRYLEHSRIFSFENGGRREVFMGSADWMERNLDRRVEVVFPVEDPDLAARAFHILDVELADNVKARKQVRGRYRRVREENEERLSAQEFFYAEQKEKLAQQESASQDRIYRPLSAPD